MKLDSNAAWNEATASIAANKEVLLALAGVFFMLPGLALALFHPQPEPAPGIQPEALMALMQEYYIGALPYAVPMALVQAIGSLAILTLFTDRSRPTVGQAIRSGVSGVLPYLGAQILFGLGIGIVAVVVLGVAGISGSGAVTAILITALIIAMIYLSLRLILVAPVVAVEQERNPITAMKRAWELSRGSAGRMALFLFLLFLAFGIVIAVTLALIGALLAVTVGADAARTIAAVLSSAMTSVMSLYFIAVLAAIHRQLSGASPQSISETFD